ncbi:RNA-dependent RNA polymerase [Reticulomyxa filosa]|uniref:RNA-dependent RNA polymerase n=1 Tax=Reticulomyxa filosa TaxID=46433 RepID=X6M8B2_RETFI|nr:RNA-dependent RNA polymerase [Reticulomyxa filosa]|eukprot:ETO09265.1 RNA-dependent RNA polymerase [Reticulomyxa filosa]
MEYDSDTPLELDRYVDMRMCGKYWLDYQINDSVGIIAEMHEALADASDLGVGSSECVQLAMAHSCAVDYAKTGVPAKLPECIPPLEAIRYPHHQQKHWQVSYESTSVKGILYNSVRIPAHHWNNRDFRKQWNFKSRSNFAAIKYTCQKPMRREPTKREKLSERLNRGCPTCGIPSFRNAHIMNLHKDSEMHQVKNKEQARECMMLNRIHTVTSGNTGNGGDSKSLSCVPCTSDVTKCTNVNNNNGSSGNNGNNGNGASKTSYLECAVGYAGHDKDDYNKRNIISKRHGVFTANDNNKENNFRDSNVATTVPLRCHSLPHYPSRPSSTNASLLASNLLDEKQILFHSARDLHHIRPPINPSNIHTTNMKMTSEHHFQYLLLTIFRRETSTLVRRMCTVQHTPKNKVAPLVRYPFFVFFFFFFGSERHVCLFIYYCKRTKHFHPRRCPFQVRGSLLQVEQIILYARIQNPKLPT